jgi:hypothetical protein
MWIKFIASASFIAAITLLTGCQGYDLNARDYADDAIQWGQPVNGLQVGLGRRTYKLGTAPGSDQIYFTVLLRNVSGRPLSILAPTAISGTVPEKRAGDESVRVTLNYDGAAGAKAAEFKPADKPAVQIMEPGKEYSLELRLSPNKFGLSHFVPGRITAAYANAQATIKCDAMGGATATGLWTGEARSGAVSVDAPTAPATREGAGQGGGDSR